MTMFSWKDYPITTKISLILILVTFIPLSGIAAFLYIERMRIINITHTEELKRNLSQAMTVYHNTLDFLYATMTTCAIMHSSPSSCIKNPPSFPYPLIIFELSQEQYILKTFPYKEFGAKQAQPILLYSLQGHPMAGLIQFNEVSYALYASVPLYDTNTKAITSILVGYSPMGNVSKIFAVMKTHIDPKVSILFGMITTTPTNKSHLFAKIPIPHMLMTQEPIAYVIAYTQQNILYNQCHAMMPGFVAIFFSITIILGLTRYAFQQTIVKPITHIYKAIENLNLNSTTIMQPVNCKISSHDELSLLAFTLNTMTYQISEDIKELHTQKETIELMFSVIKHSSKLYKNEYDLIRDILRSFQQLLPHTAITVCLLHDKMLEKVACIGENSIFKCPIFCTQKNVQCKAFNVLQQKKTVRASQSTIISFSPQPQENTKTVYWIGTPILAPLSIVGVLMLERKDSHYTDTQQTQLEAVAQQLGITLSHYHYIKTLEEQRQIFEKGQVIMCKWRGTKSFIFEYSSKNSEHLFECSPQDLLGTSYLDYIYKDDSQQILSKLQKASTQENKSLEAVYRIKTKTGQIKWVYNFMTISQPHKHRPVEYIGYFIDITAYRKSEKFLYRLKHAVETINVGITITDSTNHIIYVNHAEAHMHGYKKEELIGKHPNIFGIPEHRKKLTESEFFKITNWTRETENMRKDGSIFPVHLISTKLYENDNCNCIGVITVCEDITSKKQYEYQLHQRNTELQLFSKALAHDLMTPARSLEGLSKLLLEELQSFPETITKNHNFTDLKKYTTLINEYAIKMGNLIEASRQHTQAGEHMKIKKISSLQPIKWALDQIQAKLKKVDLVIPKRSYAILGDIPQLGRVFQNLFENSIKFSRQDITPMIHISQQRRGRFLEFIVEDNGIGFEQKYESNVFRLFKKLHADGKYSKGMGVGLAIVKKIVEQHKGHITVYSANNEGATFHIFIPLALKIPQKD